MAASCDSLLSDKRRMLYPSYRYPSTPLQLSPKSPLHKVMGKLGRNVTILRAIIIHEDGYVSALQKGKILKL